MVSSIWVKLSDHYNCTTHWKISFQFIFNHCNWNHYFSETLRLYSVVPSLVRQCTKDYKIPKTDITVEKGTLVNIPIFAIQRDEKYYPNANQFDPDRFSTENRQGKGLLDMPYLPFGDGPRNCIGLRMGKLSTKFGIASMLLKYDIELDEQHIGKELKLGLTNIIPTTGIHIKFKPRTSYVN